MCTTIPAYKNSLYEFVIQSVLAFPVSSWYFSISRGFKVWSSVVYLTSAYMFHVFYFLRNLYAFLGCSNIFPFRSLIYFFGVPSIPGILCDVRTRVCFLMHLPSCSGACSLRRLFFPHGTLGTFVENRLIAYVCFCLALFLDTVLYWFA
jgi:hypothetical protein